MSESCFILGCGKMGSALLQGWLNAGTSPRHYIIIDPFFDKECALAADARVSVYADCASAAAAGHHTADIMLLSVKPQMMAEALAAASALDVSSCCFISIAAGLSLAQLAALIPHATAPAIIRTMPNTPAAIGKGMTALIGNEAATPAQMAMAEEMLAVSGRVVRLTDEAQMDAVTALSGSGPAYLFLMAEAMTEAGTTLGLSPEMAATLAQQTILGAAHLMTDSDDAPATLRENVTSKGGTTAAALAVLQADDGLTDLMARAMQAAYDRSRSLGG